MFTDDSTLQVLQWYHRLLGTTVRRWIRHRHAGDWHVLSQYVLICCFVRQKSRSMHKVTQNPCWSKCADSIWGIVLVLVKILDFMSFWLISFSLLAIKGHFLCALFLCASFQHCCKCTWFSCILLVMYCVGAMIFATACGEGCSKCDIDTASEGHIPTCVVCKTGYVLSGGSCLSQSLLLSTLR